MAKYPTETSPIRVVVACVNAAGIPDFIGYLVYCSEHDYHNGEHYEAAKDQASTDGFEDPMLAYDENDGPGFLFDSFQWSRAAKIRYDGNGGAELMKEGT